jgi:type I restriction enzyme S subunit
MRMTGAGGQRRVPARLLDELQLRLPPIEEQRRIAGVLDAADALRVKRRQALAKLDTLTQSIFIDMFGDPVANERGWTAMPLRDVCSRIQIGPFGSLLHRRDYTENGTPIVNPMHIIDGAICPQSHQTVSAAICSRLQSYCMERGDIVMGRRGEMGRVAIVGENEDGYICGSGSLFLRPDTNKVVSEYLAAAISGSRGRSWLASEAQGVTMMNLNSAIVERFELGVPPIPLQRNFINAATFAGIQRIRQQTHLDLLDNLFASLQQRAFRGEL